jgi:hypothetical protein
LGEVAIATSAAAVNAQRIIDNINSSNSYKAELK